jgi:hypothetical protein
VAIRQGKEQESVLKKEPAWEERKMWGQGAEVKVHGFKRSRFEGEEEKGEHD